MTIALIVIIIGLTGFTIGIFLELRYQVLRMNQNIKWTHDQFRRVNTVINKMIDLAIPEVLSGKDDGEKIIQ